MSMERRPWEVWRMTSWDTPISFPTLCFGRVSWDYLRKFGMGNEAYASQCFSTAAVESMMVPSTVGSVSF
jgi:hypothetical protein